MRHPNTDTPTFCAPASRKRNLLCSVGKRLFFAAACMSIISCAPRTFAADPADPSDPVLKLLLDKGIISQQELDKVKAEAEAIRPTMLLFCRWNPDGKSTTPSRASNSTAIFGCVTKIARSTIL